LKNTKSCNFVTTFIDKDTNFIISKNTRINFSSSKYVSMQIKQIMYSQLGMLSTSLSYTILENKRQKK